MDQAYAPASANLETLFDLQIPVHSLERICRDLAGGVVAPRDSPAVPPREEEGEAVVGERRRPPAGESDDIFGTFCSDEFGLP